MRVRAIKDPRTQLEASDFLMAVAEGWEPIVEHLCRLRDGSVAHAFLDAAVASTHGRLLDVGDGDVRCDLLRRNRADI